MRISPPAVPSETDYQQEQCWNKYSQCDGLELRLGNLSRAGNFQQSNFDSHGKFAPDTPPLMLQELEWNNLWRSNQLPLFERIDTRAGLRMSLGDMVAGSLHLFLQRKHLKRVENLKKSIQFVPVQFQEYKTTSPSGFSFMKVEGVSCDPSIGNSITWSFKPRLEHDQENTKPKSSRFVSICEKLARRSRDTLPSFCQQNTANMFSSLPILPKLQYGCEAYNSCSLLFSMTRLSSLLSSEVLKLTSFCPGVSARCNSTVSEGSSLLCQMTLLPLSSRSIMVARLEMQSHRSPLFAVFVDHTTSPSSSTLSSPSVDDRSCEIPKLPWILDGNECQEKRFWRFSVITQHPHLRPLKPYGSSGYKGPSILVVKFLCRLSRAKDEDQRDEEVQLSASHGLCCWRARSHTREFQRLEALALKKSFRKKLSRRDCFNANCYSMRHCNVTINTARRCDVGNEEHDSEPPNPKLLEAL
ncbi:uncharacterized protein LOC112347370 [Selaginella moellendorffii]|uniref:uncharacterized protein LOC112347370 n=1 Tax=Selaginella moellendorffii TaxID=88036 RepID=UPI000D1C2E2F|nr:uncharacterized protein LOC112347370 [Selaginella moellendorffii]|eukprot:XP_024533873.1 uncharacterized protein LOC112347370 [Selaginella moellendorffii]